MSDLIRHATAAAHLIRDLRDALDAPTLGPRTRLILARRALYRYDITISAGLGQPADTAGRDSRRGPATAAAAPTPAADAPARDAVNPFHGVPGHPGSQLAAAPAFGQVPGCVTGQEHAPADAGKPAAPTDEHHPLPGAGGPAGAHPAWDCRRCSWPLTGTPCICVRRCGPTCVIPADADDTLVVPRPAADPALSGRHAAPDDDAATVVMPLISGVRGGW